MIQFLINEYWLLIITLLSYWYVYLPTDYLIPCFNMFVVNEVRDIILCVLFPFSLPVFV